MNFGASQFTVLETYNYCRFKWILEHFTFISDCLYFVCIQSCCLIFQPCQRISPLLQRRGEGSHSEISSVSTVPHSAQSHLPTWLGYWMDSRWALLLFSFCCSNGYQLFPSRIGIDYIFYQTGHEIHSRSVYGWWKELWKLLYVLLHFRSIPITWLPKRRHEMKTIKRQSPSVSISQSANRISFVAKWNSPVWPRLSQKCTATLRMCWFLKMIAPSHPLLSTITQTLFPEENLTIAFPAQVLTIYLLSKCNCV